MLPPMTADWRVALYMNFPFYLNTFMGLLKRIISLFILRFFRNGSDWHKNTTPRIPLAPQMYKSFFVIFALSSTIEKYQDTSYTVKWSRFLQTNSHFNETIGPFNTILERFILNWGFSIFFKVLSARGLFFLSVCGRQCLIKFPKKEWGLWGSTYCTIRNLRRVE